MAEIRIEPTDRGWEVSGPGARPYALGLALNDLQHAVREAERLVGRKMAGQGLTIAEAERREPDKEAAAEGVPVTAPTPGRP